MGHQSSMAATRGRAFLSDHLLGAAAFRNSNGLQGQALARRTGLENNQPE